MIEEIDQNAKIALDDETQGRTNDDEMFRVNYHVGEEVVMETTTGVKDSGAPTTNVIKDEVTMAQALVALKSTKPKKIPSNASPHSQQHLSMGGGFCEDFTPWSCLTTNGSRGALTTLLLSSDDSEDSWKLQLKSNQSKDKVLPNNSHVKAKKTQVEVHPKIPNVSNKTKSVTTCKDSLNSRTLNANAVCATCYECLVDSNHFACVSKMLNDVHATTKKPTVVPISTRKPKSQANKSMATPNKKKIVQPILFIVDSGCTKHMMVNLKLLCNFIEKFLGTVRFGNDQFAPILGYGDLVAFRKYTCFVRDLQGNDLLVGNRGSDLYTISIQQSTSSTSLCLMAKVTPTQAWLWHRRLSHLNFDYINLLSKKDIVIGLPKLKYVKDKLCSSCELSKAKRSSFKSKVVPSSKERLNLLHMDLCGPMRVASTNLKKYILVIVDDYLRYTWTLFLRSKDETPEVLKYFPTMIQRNLQALVITVHIDRGTEFLNKTLNAFFKEEGIEHV
nr:hypothetical protein [Tanacetum cinerariifolium]